MKTKNIVNRFDFSALPIKIDYVGQVNDKEWPHFLYNVTFRHASGFWTTPFKCGLGHVIKPRHPKAPARPIPPTNADIMYALLLDMDAANESFPDWCTNLGYDSDSISALNIYRVCCETAGKLRKTFTREQLEQMKTALEDY